MITKLDWALVQSFLAVSETGSLSAAARRLGLSQPTLGRQVKQMEAALGVDLFQRQPRGLVPTEAGEALLPHAKSMSEAMRGLHLAAAGQSERLRGPVRLTASVFVATHLLPPILAQLRQAEPEIEIDLVPTDRAENLLFREADLAVRMTSSTQLDIVTRKLGELEIGLFGARSLLDREGWPQTLEEALSMDLVGYDQSELLLRGLRSFGVEAQRDWFATRCDNHAVAWELVRAGCGLGFVMAEVAGREPSVARLFPDLATPGLPVWLAAHEAVRHSPRVARVWSALAQGLSPFVCQSPTPGGRIEGETIVSPSE